MERVESLNILEGSLSLVQLLYLTLKLGVTTCYQLRELNLKKY